MRFDKWRARDADGAALSDEAVLAGADFGLFIDLASMCQKEEEEWKLGLYWTQLDEKPEQGTELAAAALSRALAGGQTSFERAEIDGLSVEGLGWGCFIRAGEAWFAPTGRTPSETALFRHALQSLDVAYAHRGLASLLSTRLPEGVDVPRGYDARGWVRLRAPLDPRI